MDKPSDAYFDRLEEAKLHHDSSKTFSGKFLRPHAPFIKEIIDKLGCKSILDYGCGKGLQYEWRNQDESGSIPIGMTIEEFWGIKVVRYDPAWPPFSAEPEGQFDLVLCTHVLGSIPIVDLPWVVGRLFGYARKAIYVAEKIGEVRKIVHGARDGMPNSWSRRQWERILTSRNPAVEVTLATRQATEIGVFVERGMIA